MSDLTDERLREILSSPFSGPSQEEAQDMARELLARRAAAVPEDLRERIAQEIRGWAYECDEDAEFVAGRILALLHISPENCNSTARVTPAGPVMPEKLSEQEQGR